MRIAQISHFASVLKNSNTTIVNDTQDANSSRRSNTKEKLSVSYHSPYKDMASQGLTRLLLLRAKAVSCLFLHRHGLTNCSTSTCTITGRCNMTLVLNWFLQSAMQLAKCSPCAPGFTLTGQCVRADSVFGPLGACSAAVAACNMWPQRLPAFPASIFHYSLFNSSPCCWTAVPSLTTFTSCQESLRPNCFPTEENWFIRQQGNWIFWGHKTWQLKTWYWRFRLLIGLGSNLWLIWSNRLWHLTSTDKVQENEELSARLPSVHSNSDESMNGKVFFFFTPINIVCQFAHNLPMAFWTENCKSLMLVMHVSRPWMESSKCTSKGMNSKHGVISLRISLISIHGQFCKTQLSRWMLRHWTFLQNWLGWNSVWQKKERKLNIQWREQKKTW